MMNPYIWRRRRRREVATWPASHVATVGECHILAYTHGGETHYTFTRGRWESPSTFRTIAAATAAATFWRTRDAENIGR